VNCEKHPYNDGLPSCPNCDGERAAETDRATGRATPRPRVRARAFDTHEEYEGLTPTVMPRSMLLLQ
jgi:hypothetical protein